MPVPDIDTLKCVFMEFSSRRRMIGCVTEEVFNKFMSSEGMKESFDLFYPVDVMMSAPVHGVTMGVQPASIEDQPMLRMAGRPNDIAYKLWYVYLPNCDFAKPSEPVIRVSGPTIETIHLYEELGDAQLHMIYDVEARKKVPAIPTGGPA